jgi:hypothetical protein
VIGEQPGLSWPSLFCGEWDADDQGEPVPALRHRARLSNR